MFAFNNVFQFKMFQLKITIAICLNTTNLSFNQGVIYKQPVYGKIEQTSETENEGKKWVRLKEENSKLRKMCNPTLGQSKTFGPYRLVDKQGQIKYW